jgi:hypothetical protein
LIYGLWFQSLTGNTAQIRRQRSQKSDILKKKL